MADFTKRAIKQQLGIETDTQLALFFKVSKGAVSQWSDEDPIPRARQWQAASLRPDLFGADAVGTASKPAKPARKRAA